ncbi:ESPR-type extended signal peptide-containing protein [uncultured Dialister sp.]|uniref:ESPR-type extended signal peptide-containing protein n=1 Tax=uncultured Dialister sp. TaxID=278064 RepID=UPI0026275D76|nr:ESPR-type extended signal peptide-containing protein [uncultured Dialister sp.]
MNRVYKVIWSKAKHCYVVTSEIAKGYGKSAGSKGVKALLSGLVALSIAMGGYGLAGAVYVESKDTPTDPYVTQVYTKEETITELAKKADKATTLAGYGITDAYTKTETDAALNGKANTATTLEGYGITDAYTKTETDAALNGKADKATTLEGYGITDAYTKTEVDGKISAEENARKAADKDNLKVDGNGVISKVSNDGTTSSPVNKLVLKVDGDNQITMDEKGIKVGTNSTVIGSDGSIKGANGKFTVDANGQVTANGGVDTNSGDILTRGGKINAGSGDISGGNISASGNLHADGDISGKDITGSGTVTGHAVTDGTARMEGGALTGVTTITAGGDVVSTGGKVQGTSVSDGTATLSGGSLNNAVDINASGTITGNNVVVKGKLTTNGLETDRITLGSETLNQTDINKGEVTSKVNDTVGAVEYTAESIFNKDGSSITARTDEGIVDSTGKSIVGAKEISQYLGNNAKPESSDTNVTRKMVRNDDGTFSMEDTAVDEGKSSTVSQNAGERKVTVAEGTKNLNVTENLTNGIVSETDDGAGNKVTLTQGMDGTYIVETSGTSTEDIGGQKIENYKGGLDTNITGDETHDVSGNMTTTVTGDSSLTAENITNEAKNKITNKAIDVETDATSSIVQKVTNDAGSNTSTQWSYQTKEEMSQADGKTASYLRGAAEEKSQLTNGAKKTTIDTVAGQTNTNITDGTNTSNDLQKADQIASSVTDGTNTTVVNQDARSLASSITDGTGTKVNNSIHWVDGSAQRIEVDDTHFYAETRTAEKAEEALKSGNTVIDIVKDTNTATVSSAVTDGATITGISQNAKDISLSAAGGTITNDANDVLNKGANSVINEVGANQVAVMTDSVKAAYGSDTYTTWNGNGITNNAKDKTVATNAKDILNTATGDMENKVGGNLTNNVTGNMTSNVTGDSSLSANNITNTATVKLSNSAADIENTATNSITDKVGENVERTMGTKKIEESVKDGTKSNTFTKTAKKDMNIITDGTNTSTLSQLADKVNTSLKEVDGAGNTTKSLNNVKTVSEDTTKMTDAASGEFSKRSQTVSQIQDKVGKTTVTTIDGKTTLTDEYHNHTTEMDYAHVTKDLSVERDTTLGKEGENTNLTVNSKSEFKDTVKMDSTLEVDRTSTFNDKVTITKNGLAVTGGTTTDTLNVTGETRTGTLHVNGNGHVGGDLNVDGNIETHDAVLSADSRQVVTGRQLYQTNERVDRLDNRIKKVGANAAALAALRPGDFNPDDKFSIAAGFGSYRNASAAALGLFYRPNENVLLSLGTSFGDGENMVNAGVSVKFGRGKSMAERRKEMADEVSSMRDEMRSQDERIAELEEMLKKQSELIEKLSKES